MKLNFSHEANFNCSWCLLKQKKIKVLCTKSGFEENLKGREIYLKHKTRYSCCLKDQWNYLEQRRKYFKCWRNIWWSAWSFSQLFTCSTWTTVISSITMTWMHTNTKCPTSTRPTAMRRIKVSVKFMDFPPKDVERKVSHQKFPFAF